MKYRAWMDKVDRNKIVPGSVPAVVASIEAVLRHLDQAMSDVESQIADHFDQHPGLKAQRDLLVSIPGIGQATAAVLLGELPHLSQYGTARQVAAYAGLVPRHRQSGTSIHGKPRLSKVGNARLRRALYMPAISAKRYNPLIAAFCQRLLERGKPKMAVVGAAMRKLLHLAFAVLKSQMPFDPAYGQSKVLAGV